MKVYSKVLTLVIFVFIDALICTKTFKLLKPFTEATILHHTIKFDANVGKKERVAVTTKHQNLIVSLANQYVQKSFVRFSEQFALL